MTETITIPTSLARLLMAEDQDFTNPETAGDARALARASLRLLVVSNGHAQPHHDPEHDEPAATQPAAPKRFMSKAARQAISRRMRAYWKEKRAAAAKKGK